MLDSAQVAQHPQVWVACDDRLNYQCLAAVVRGHRPITDTVVLDLRFDTGRALTVLRRGDGGRNVPIVIATTGNEKESALSMIRTTRDRELLRVIRASAIQPTLRIRLTPEYIGGSPAPEHLRIASTLARACASEDASIEAFLVCAGVVRRLHGPAMQVPFTPLLNDVFDMLRRPPHPSPRLWDARVRSLTDALHEGDVEALRRSEADWGRQFGVHAAHLGRLVHAHTGQRFRDWRRICRLKRAAQLLVRDDEQVAQVGFAAGFGDASQFGREFRLLFGLTPREFRRQLLRPRLALDDLASHPGWSRPVARGV